MTFAGHGLALGHQVLVFRVLLDVVLGLHSQFQFKSFLFNLIIPLAY